MHEWLTQFNTYFSEQNVGKANIVNYLHKNARKCDYIFSIDSDMYSNEEINTLDFMIDILKTEFNIGIVSSNQYELPQHWFDTHIKVIEGRQCVAAFTFTRLCYFSSSLLSFINKFKK